jgi:hypothetical protein
VVLVFFPSFTQRQSVHSDVCCARCAIVGYNHVSVTAQLYDGTTREAIAYRFKPERVAMFKVNNPPGERYLVRLSLTALHLVIDKSNCEWRR